jgi:hypothetical protein
MGVSVSFLEQGEQPGAVAAATPTGVFVPGSAVVQRDGRSVVFVIEGTHARQQAVRADAPSGELRAVEGIDAGAQVVRQPPPGLHDGATIVLQK